MKRIILFFIFTLCTTSLFSQIPTQFQLYQNTPDPFDTSGTEIPFDLPISASVSLWVEDSIGNRRISDLLVPVIHGELTDNDR